MDKSSNIVIDEDYLYRECQSRGIEPLLGIHFDMPIKYRVLKQIETFGNTIMSIGKKPQANDKFYHWVWNNKPHQCEECLMPLHGYSAVFISHIKTKGAFPEMAHDPRNTNILCFKHHNIWENDNLNMSMRIYRKNIKTIEMLKNEYNQLTLRK